MRVLFAGNCQAPLLASMFATATHGVSIVSLEPTYTMREDQKDAVLQKMHEADVVFVQRTSANYFLDWLRSDFLRLCFAGKCFVWPNVYFDGYFPQTCYIYREDVGKLLSPLEDYHMSPLIGAYRRGLALSAAVMEFENPDVATHPDPFEASFVELERREQDVDVVISDFLRETARVRRCVYTPNHPCNFVLAELGARLAKKVGLAFDLTAASEIKYCLDRIYISAFPAIVKQLLLPFDLSPLFRGVKVSQVMQNEITLGLPRAYLVEDLVETYWRIYDKFPP